jgi:PIN domain nuclease of toxin-antitoxin system
MTTTDPGVVLDTHVLLWLLEGDDRVSRPVRQAIDNASSEGSAHVSAMTIWEVAMLVAKDRIRLTEDVRAWADAVVTNPALTLVPLAPEIAVESTRLPGTLHRDPCDRIITATARTLGARLVTADRTLIGYGEAGHVRVLAAT